MRLADQIRIVRGSKLRPYWAAPLKSPFGLTRGSYWDGTRQGRVRKLWVFGVLLFGWGFTLMRIRHHWSASCHFMNAHTPAFRIEAVRR